MTDVRVPYNYLPAQFAEHTEILAGWADVISSCEFTLGPFVADFEAQFALYTGARYCVATNTGTDALILALKALGVGAGDEILTPCNSFYATAGAIVAAGATPVFCDVDERYQMNPTDMARRVTTRTRALLPVHWAGASPDMDALLNFADEHGLDVVEDACMGIGGRWRERHPGTFGRLGAFSMHPLKTLNVMGDGGMVVTDDDALHSWMVRYRNHGMIDRDHIEFWGVNMRLQPLQAVVGKVMMRTLDTRIAKRRSIQDRLDSGLSGISPRVTVPPRHPFNEETVSLYMVLAEQRDALMQHLIENGIEAKIHYPVPLHLQPAAQDLGYGRGSLPVGEMQASHLLTLPAHEYLTDEQVDFTISVIHDFEGGS